MPPSPGFHEHKTTQGGCSFGMTQGEDLDMAIELATTPIEDTVEPQAVEYNVIVPLLHLNTSTTGTTVSAVDIIPFMKDISVHGISANQIIHLYPEPMLTSFLVPVFVGTQKQSNIT